MFKSLAGLSFVISILLSNPAQAQNIGGVVNDYASVSAISGTTLTLKPPYSTASFGVGKRVVIIQMKGATIHTDSSSSSFGTISAINSAGNYEFATITAVNPAAKTVKLSQGLAATYATSGIVQLVSIPQYTNVTVTSTLTADPWDPTTGTGGVVALEVVNTITLQANIDASGKGFQGGAPNSIPNNGFNISTVYAAGEAAGFGGKGEGIASVAANQLNARGPLASGGGGGSTHNAGGGGGSNYTAGGLGGRGYDNRGLDYGPGLGGKSLSSYYTTPKLFLGGGGGGGQQNNEAASAGGNGGGIILIRASKLTTSGARSILSNGNQAPASSNDGAGGGGAGGTIVLDINTYLLSATNTLSAHANGGHGGNVVNDERHGSGGGGGTGIILYSRPTAPANATFTSVPGDPGTDCNTCSSSGSAGDGGTNCNGSCSIPNYTPPGDLALPIVLIHFDGHFVNGKVVLEWQTASETNNNFFTVEKSLDAVTFEPVVRITSPNGNTRQLQSYTAVDSTPQAGNNYYQLRQTDLDGKTTLSKLIAVYALPVTHTITLHPNPVVGKVLHLTVADEHPGASLHIHITNVQGQEVYSKTIQRKTTQLFLKELSAPGLYIIRLSDGPNIYTEKLVVE